MYLFLFFCFGFKKPTHKTQKHKCRLFVYSFCPFSVSKPNQKKLKTILLIVFSDFVLNRNIQRTNHTRILLLLLYSITLLTHTMCGSKVTRSFHRQKSFHKTNLILDSHCTAVTEYSHYSLVVS